MRSTGESLADKISKGETFLKSLEPTDPKRETAQRNLEKLKDQLTEGSTSGRYEPPFIETDPRPDLSEDSVKWSELLTMALDQDKKMCGVLNGLRCGGTRLRIGRDSSGENRWVLHPDIDPTGRVAWESQADYEEMRDKYLKPYFAEVTTLLRELAHRFPPV